MIRRLHRFVLELDPVDMLLIASVAEYAVQVRNLLAIRRKHRQQLATMEPPPFGAAGVDGAAAEAAADASAAATDVGGDHATADIPNMTPAAAEAIVELAEVDRELRGR